MLRTTRTLTLGLAASALTMLACTRGTEKEPAPKIAAAQNEPLDMKFVKVLKGTFWMSEGGKNAQKQKTIAADFELAAYTVTQAQWQEVMGDNPSYFSRQGEGNQAVQGISDEDLKRFPVELVSWDMVQEFLEKLNDREAGHGYTYRLPSEAEWEYACRGGATSKEDCSFDYYLDKASNDLSSNQANFNGGFPAGNGAKGPYLNRTTKVGSYRPNKLGLYDMHGNLWQWCSDLYDAAGSVRVIRGGSWNYIGRICRAAERDKFAPSNRHNLLGFRLARVPSGG